MKHARPPSAGTRPDAAGLPSDERKAFWETIEAALASRGSFEVMAARLSLDAPALTARLKLLCSRKFARRLVVTALPRPGLDIEVRSYVKVAPSAEALDSFEAFCMADDRVVASALVTGRHDYVLTSFHGGLGDVREWSRALRTHPDVARVDVQPITTISGLFEYCVLPANALSKRKRKSR